MKFPKSILIVTLTTLIFTSCKETASNAVASTDQEENQVEKEKKPVLKPEVATLKIDGMTCAMGCAKTIEKSLSKMEGVQEVKVNFDKKEAIVNFDAAVLDAKKLSKEIEACADGKTYKVTETHTKS